MRNLLYLHSGQQNEAEKYLLLSPESPFIEGSPIPFWPVPIHLVIP
jgi:hypothetical protein